MASGASQGSLIGTTLGGYEVQTLIGRGAMGTVYLARDVKLHRRVALKVLLGSLAKTPSVVKQFHQEAQATAPLKHPSIVRVYSAGLERGTPYIAMEFVDGEPMDRFLKRKGPIQWQHAMHVASQVAMALDCAHRYGVIHRDVKPSNIMVDRKGKVRLTDFGIANIQSDDDDGPSDNGAFLGTPQYMSPEQCSGGEVGPASDLFSLGVVLYQMIAGELPFHGESSMALVKSICTEDPPRLNKIVMDVPDDVARLVAYLMEKEPGMRPANARVVQSLIQRLQEKKGGTSAVPEALTAFLREESDPRAFAGLNKDSSKKRSRRGSRDSTTDEARRPIDWPKIGRIAALILLGLTALSAGPVAGTFAREGKSVAAPAVDMALFREVSPSVTLAQFLADAFEFRGLHWAGDDSLLIVEARGRSGGLTHGAAGVLAFRPETNSFVSLQAPSGPAMDVTHRDSAMLQLTSSNLPPLPPRSPLHESILFQTAPRRDGAIVTLAQRWDEAVPRPAILHRDRVGDDGSGLPTGAGSRLSSAAIHPDGRTICVYLRDPEFNRETIVERIAGQKPLDRNGPNRLSHNRNVVPQSLQYSPSGRYITYICRDVDGKGELWILESGKTMPDGKRLTHNVVGNHAAFSPDGGSIAVSVRPEGQPNPVVRVMNVNAPDQLIDLGPGIVSAEAWLPSGRELIAVTGLNGDETGAPQLWRIGVEGSGARARLTNLPNGVKESFAVSRNGRWVAGLAAQEETPTLVLVDLNAGSNAGF